MLRFVLNHLPRPSSILSIQVGFVAAQLLHADRIEHALSPYYKDQEQLLYKPASSEAVQVPGSAGASEQRPLLGCAAPPIDSIHKTGGSSGIKGFAKATFPFQFKNPVKTAAGGLSL